MSLSNYISKIAVVGANGRIGGSITRAILANTKAPIKQSITAVTRSTSPDPKDYPSGVSFATVDYSNESSIVSALQGHDMVIISLAVSAGPEPQMKLIEAAAKADVKYVMPNAWGYDIFSESLTADLPRYEVYRKGADLIKAKGMTYITLTCGFWYEWSLGLFEPWYGFNIREKTVTFFDDGKTLLDTSTWEQCGRAVATLVALPISDAKPNPCLRDFANSSVPIRSFTVSQRDMLDSLNRVMGTSDSDWTIKYEETGKRVSDAGAQLAKGDFSAFPKLLYSRLFYPGDEARVFSKTLGLQNETLGLPVESIDEATGRTVKMVESGWNPVAYMGFK